MRLRFRVNKMHPDGSPLYGDNADAHCDPESPEYGTICFRTPEDAVDMATMVHELAHIQVSGPFKGHTEEWLLRYVRMLKGINPEIYGNELRMQPWLITAIYGGKE